MLAALNIYCVTCKDFFMKQYLLVEFLLLTVIMFVKCIDRCEALRLSCFLYKFWYENVLAELNVENLYVYDRLCLFQIL